MDESVLWDFDFYVDYSEDNFWKRPNANTHFHMSYEIYYLVENEIKYFISGRPYILTPGTIIVVPPKAIHSTQMLNDKIRKRYLINLPENYIFRFLELAPDLLTGLSEKMMKPQGITAMSVENIFEGLVKEYERKDSNRIMLESLLGQLLILLHRCNKDDEKYYEKSKASTKIAQIINYVNNNYNEELSVGRISRLFFLDPSYVCRLFKKETDMTFQTYLKTIRIRTACELLVETDISITKISERIGFKSCTDFCRVFKKTMKISPMQYRRSILHKMPQKPGQTS